MWACVTICLSEEEEEEKKKETRKKERKPVKLLHEK